MLPGRVYDCIVLSSSEQGRQDLAHHNSEAGRIWLIIPARQARTWLIIRARSSSELRQAERGSSSERGRQNITNAGVTQWGYPTSVTNAGVMDHPTQWGYPTSVTNAGVTDHPTQWGYPTSVTNAGVMDDPTQWGYPTSLTNAGVTDHPNKIGVSNIRHQRGGDGSSEQNAGIQQGGIPG